MLFEEIAIRDIRMRNRIVVSPMCQYSAQDAEGVRSRIQKNKVEMHYRSFPDAEPPLFQIFLKDPDDVTIELNFLGEKVKEEDWKGKGSASAVTLKKASGKKTAVQKQ